MVAACTNANAANLDGLPKSASTESRNVSEHMRASLLVDAGGADDNAEGRVGVLFELEPGWHAYWQNPGETGLPPEFEWSGRRANGEQVVEGDFGATQWPTPIPFKGGGTGLVSYGYADQVLLMNPVADFRSLKSVSVDASILICADECIPVGFTLSRDLLAKQPAVTADAERALFAKFAEQVPRDATALDDGLAAHYSSAELAAGDVFEGAIAIESCKTQDPNCIAIVPSPESNFFPDEPTDEALSFAFVRAVPHPEQPSVTLLRFRATLESDLDELPSEIGGVLQVKGRDGEQYAVSLALPFPASGQAATGSSIEIAPAWMAAADQLGSGATAETAGALSGMQLLRVILLALIGGLILNGMPCVLPVLGIKICSAAELAQHDPAELRRHGFAYLAGVLASMATLALAVVMLQAAGTSVGWGFQFQEPLFVAAVACVVVLFALNLFGVFEIQIGTQRLSEVGATTQGTTRSFFDGLLAVVLATPCTAPFLGTAVGFAFAGGASMIFAIFLAIGAGLAAPYTLICFIPGWSRFVPRAGNWMLRLRTGLGFLLLATAVWLIWIFGRTAGVDGQATLLAVLVALSFVVWLFSWTQARPTATLAAGVSLFFLSGLTLNTIEATPIEEASDVWVNFNADAIDATLAQNQPVFVSFTADWCITCKVNERGVLAEAQVRAALSDGGFRWFRGDWTQRDEIIRKELARHGRAGVPLYLVYDPNSPNQPEVLPEILSVDVVLNALTSVHPIGNSGS